MRLGQTWAIKYFKGYIPIGYVGSQLFTVNPNKLFAPLSVDIFIASYICRALLVAFTSVGLWISPRISRAHIS